MWRRRSSARIWNNFYLRLIGRGMESRWDNLTGVQSSHSLAFTAEIPKEKLMFYIAFNSHWEDLEFELPSMEQWLNVPWRRWIDTSLDSPADIVDWHIAASVPGLKYSVASRSIVILFARLPD
jgi:isoamylase